MFFPANLLAVGIVLKKLNITQQKQTTKNKIQSNLVLPEF